MKTTKQTAGEVTPTKTKVSRAGRRPKGDGSGGPELSRDTVIQCAVTLAQSESIEEISIARLARELGVATGLIHYYIGNRGDLLSTVINTAIKDRLASLPPLVGDWRVDLLGVARSSLESYARWPGLANYIATQNRFRLFQRVQPGETDYGLAYFDHVGRIFQQGGFTQSQAALAYHLLMLFVTSMAAESAQHQAPAEHKDFILGYLSGFDRDSIPGASYIAGSFTELDNATTFDGGMQLLLTGFQDWLASNAPQRAQRRTAKPRSATPQDA